jgi:hypothetical protein
LRWLSGLVVLYAAMAPGLSGAQPVHHDLTVALDPGQRHLSVQDTVTFPPGFSSRTGAHRFELHSGWEPTTSDPGVTVKSANGGRHALTLADDRRTVTLTYAGTLSRPGDTGGDDHGDDLSLNAVVLSHGSRWYPTFGDELVTFTLSVRAPAGWEVISQGRRVARETGGDRMTARWESNEPQDEIYLVGGPLVEYTRQTGGITAMAFLRSPDPALAERYLEATGRYVAMYTALLGPYPYSKFAMVENAWETGYGMPSFTLLGPAVIRLPFILHSSYPHEILHNWWGNGVFVDARRGNWSEGLTAYLADHLMAEQRGSGAEYRRAALQQYADYVSHERDFPLAEFTARHSPATQAVGYGKALMVFHMVRRDLGDDAFLAALRDVFQRFRFRRASFDDLERAFARAANGPAVPLGSWIDKPGAPALTVNHVEAEALDGRYLLKAQVEQTQVGAPYRLRVPVAVTLEGREDAYQTTFLLDRKRLGLELIVPARPLWIDVDPEYDLFRRLDPAERPPALSRMFGAERAMVILPAAAPDALRQGYRRLAETLVRPPDSADIVTDEELERLPTDRAVWVLGWENRFRQAVHQAMDSRSVTMNERTIRIAGTELTRERNSVVLVGDPGGAPGSGVAWLGCDQLDALPGLQRKLPHYGKYGYLGFEGREPTNVVKGEWPVVRSPLSSPVKIDGAVPSSRTTKARLETRRSLAEAGGSKGTPQ